MNRHGNEVRRERRRENACQVEGAAGLATPPEPFALAQCRALLTTLRGSALKRLATDVRSRWKMASIASHHPLPDRASAGSTGSVRFRIIP
jgi:hypothetical protein